MSYLTEIPHSLSKPPNFVNLIAEYSKLSVSLHISDCGIKSTTPENIDICKLVGGF
jgi:hypothetical protein